MRDHGLEATRILLVEDAKDIRDVFSMLLQAAGAEVIATGSGAEAAAIATRQDFDLLLTDLGLPDMPGDMVIRHVLDGARRRPRVVVVTGYDDSIVIRSTDPFSRQVVVSRGAFRVRNSWGTTWGQSGYGWLPYDYVRAGLTSDWWSLTKAEYLDTGEFGPGTAPERR